MKSTSARDLNRIARALRFSLQGLRAAWRDEPAFRQELMAFAVLAPVTLWLDLPPLELVVLFALMGGVLAVELMNSAIEAIVDKASPEHHPLAGKAKDCASAAVLLVCLILAGAWLLLAGPAFAARIAAALT